MSNRKQTYRNAYNNIADGTVAGSAQLAKDVKLGAVYAWAFAWLPVILVLNLLLIGAATAAAGRGGWDRLRHNLI
jgi:hypothetical protein